MDKKYVSISDLNRYIKTKFDLDRHLSKVYLKGEISNYKNHTRGHLYFTLKDETSRISAVMFSSAARSLSFVPKDGMSVLITGRVAVYEANGGYQIYVDSMELDGEGNLAILFEELKNKLYKEGLFDKSHKKLIPKYPKRIGIITASTGAAIRDVLSTIKRRYPICETILFPCLVQGEYAKDDIVKNLLKAQEYDLDVIICGRGGGSIEDLWAFNEEIVARAIYDCKIPVISAVGHEVDFTIADFVADLRAPTPTGAAEMAVPDIRDVNMFIDTLRVRLNENINNLLIINKNRLESISNSFVLKNPLSLYEIKEQKLDSLIDKSNNLISNILSNNTIRFNNLIKSNILRDPLINYKDKVGVIELYISRCYNSINELLQSLKYKLELDINTLELVNPLNILSKGYNITYKDKVIVKSINDVSINDDIDIKLSKGSIKATVKEIEFNE